MDKRLRFSWVLAAIGALAICAVTLMLVVGRSSGPSQGSQAPAEEVIVADRTQEPPADGPSDTSSAAIPQEGGDPSQGGDAEASPGLAGETSYSIPDDAEYASNVVLVNIPEGMSAEEVESLLEQTGAVGSVHVSEEDLASGVVAVDVVEGMQVEDAINAIREESPELSAQPNFYYHAMLGDEGDLRDLLEEPLDAQAEEPEEAASDVPSDVEEEASVPEPSDGGESADDVQEEQEEQEAEAQEGAEPLAPEEEAAVEGEAADDPDAEGVTESEAAPAEDGPATLMEALSVKTDDAYADRQWALTSMRAYEAWSIARCEGKVAIAVLDQTPDVTHEDLAGNVAFYYDVHAGSDQMATTKRHGTHVTGVASAVSNNELGVSGVSYNATLLVMNVFDSSGSCSTDDLCKAYARLMDMADEQNLHVINLSLGGKVSSPDFTDDAFLAVVDKAYEEHDIVTVAAAANASSSAKVPYYEYPGDAERVVSVMNLRQNGDSVERSTTSNYNVPGQRGKDICAPGSSIYSTVLNNDYGYESGTSMAAPQVSGVLALEFAANPNLTAAEAMSILYNTAVDLGDPGWDEGYGYGEVDAYAAVLAANPLLGAEITVSPTSFTYTGEACVPSVTVSVDGKALTEGEDYSVSFANNVNAGTATVTVVSETYGGSASSTFTIEPIGLNAANVTLSATSFYYTGSALTPKISVVVGGKTLASGSDYSTSFINNVEVGEAKVVVKGRGNYTGTVEKSFVIKPYGTWVASGARWRYRLHDGLFMRSQFLKDGSKTYWFDNDGWMVTGWRSIGGSWYYFSGSGAMAKGWLKDRGTWYYLKGSGAMATGWLNDQGTWYWFSGSGAMVTGWRSIGGTWYYFSGSGAMATGWRYISGSWYYLKGSGAMATGWLNDRGTWYWLYGSGAMAKSRWVGNYYIGSNGIMLTNRLTPDGYYVRGDGSWDGKPKRAA